MNKILLSTIALSALLLAEQSVEEQQQQISDTKAQIKALQDSLKKMEASLPEQIKKEQEAQAEKYKIKTHAEMGYVNTKGNTNTESYTLDAVVKKNWDKQSLALSVDAQYASDNGIDTKNKYLTELEYSHKLCGKLSFEYLAGYKYDEFSGYDYRAYTGPGLKYQLIDTQKHNLVLGGNILYARDKLSETQVVNEYASLRAKVNYSWQMLENLKFQETFTYRTEVAEIDNSSIFSKTAFITKINSMFSASLSYKVDYVNKPGEDKKHSDRTLGANLIADF